MVQRRTRALQGPSKGVIAALTCRGHARRKAQRFWAPMAANGPLGIESMSLVTIPARYRGKSIEKKVTTYLQHGQPTHHKGSPLAT